jgi:hypothetical protein
MHISAGQSWEVVYSIARGWGKWIVVAGFVQKGGTW